MNESGRSSQSCPQYTDVKIKDLFTCPQGLAMIADAMSRFVYCGIGRKFLERVAGRTMAARGRIPDLSQ